jgi:hypothetical protein
LKRKQNEAKRYKHGNKDDVVTLSNSTSVTDSIYNDNLNNNNGINSMNNTITPNPTPIPNASTNSTAPINNNPDYEITNPLSDVRCKAECWVNCQVHFPDMTEQKFCIKNVCHCVIANPTPEVSNITSSVPSAVAISCKSFLI